MEFSRLLAIDIGTGTQDILIYDKSLEIENCIKMILPSYTRVLASRVKGATEEGRDIFFHGGIMGGCPLSSAVKKHIKAGYKVYSTQKAAKTFKDNLEKVKSWGIELIEEDPGGCFNLELMDLNLEILEKTLSNYYIELPSLVAIAVQDHGECIEGSNRKFRFSHWKRFLEKGGKISDLIYKKPPEYFTRMLSIQKSLKGETFFMDTGPAGILGTFCDPLVEKFKDTGVVIVNIGNQHFISSMVRDNRIFAILEHHTREMYSEKIFDTIRRFKEKDINDEEVFSDRGHGVYYSKELKEDTSKWPVVITGPKRKLALKGDYYFAVPHGDMMLSGCFGLLEALRSL
ncbi:pyruvate formate lyase-activating protein [Candidatus Parcubacteria bacterium]|nr:MAG: pyruvate formate lyase-activating protein [Candidatus Parcubacteria bacterium]